MDRILNEFQQKIGYTFKDVSLLKLALTHSSYANEHRLDYSMHNERLEFLGDAVLELVSSDFLFRNHPEMKEGDMSKKRAAMVCEPALAHCAGRIDLGSYLFLGKGEDLGGGRTRDSVTSDAMEALIGAIYLDGGFTTAKEFTETYVLGITSDATFFYDSKTILQELSQEKFAKEPVYRLVAENGPDHQKEFVIEVMIGDVVYGTGKGKSKKAAQQEAAHHAVTKLKESK
ncbi:MAG: ribonuclease III [Lachnospiraceae bacterium]|nr:ribonuclease III [Lachnospiraceae bacterium]